MATTKLSMNTCCSILFRFAFISPVSFCGRARFSRKKPPELRGVNLAVAAAPSSSFVSSDTTVAALNSDATPRSSRDNRRGSYGNWPRTGTEWVQYEWAQPISTKQMDVYWWADGQGVGAPKACRLLYWDGKDFVPVAHADGLGVAGKVQHHDVRRSHHDEAAAGNGFRRRAFHRHLSWKVYDSGKSPDFPPTVAAGVDREVVVGGKTYLSGIVEISKADGKATVVWSKASGPGEGEVRRRARN